MKQAIAVILPTMSQTIEQDIIRGIRQGLAGSDCIPLFVTIGYLKPEAEFRSADLSMIKGLRQLPLAGVLLYGGGVGYLSGDAVMQKLLEMLGDLPVVNIGSELAGISSVVVDNYHGMYQLAEHLIHDAGCERFLYIDGPHDNQEGQQRIKALKDALQEHLPEQAKLETLPGDMTPSTAQYTLRRWLREGLALPDAIVCVNDLTAKGVIDELELHNIAVPEQVKVTGFDDFEYAATMRPSLSTALYPSEECGKQAALMLLDKLDRTVEPSTLAVASKAIIRRSSGAREQATPIVSEAEQRRTLILQRDGYAQRLSITRLLYQRRDLQAILIEAQHTLRQLSIEELYLYQQLPEGYQLQFALHPQHLSIEEHSKTLPESFHHSLLQQGYWVLSELKFEDKHYGYLLAQSDALHSDFVEFIAPQLADILESQRLEKEARRYQQQAELSERMAALGGLVSGVAHEINTPVGTSLLAASHLKESVARLEKAYSGNQLSKNKLEQFLKEAAESTEIINSSSFRAAELIASFKQVAVDQSYEEKRLIDLASYINDVLRSLQHRLKTTNVRLETDLCEGIELLTYPGAIAQVLTNLFMNSLLHGFEQGQRAGCISISLSKGKLYHILEFSDDGKGLAPEVLEHIFEPFYTTARNQGGSGLGMHIVYNLLSQKLNWKLDINSSPGQGVRYHIHIPVQQAD